MPPPPPTVLPCPLVLELWHRDDVHIAEHTKWANGDAARMLFRQRPDVKAQFTFHLAQHQARLAMQQMAAQLAAAPAEASRGAVGGGRAMQNSNQESGKRGANQSPPA